METARRSSLATQLTLLALIGASSALIGCDRDPEPVYPGEVNLYGSRATPWDPSMLPVTYEEQLGDVPPEFAEIVEQVDMRGAAMFEQAPPPTVLHELELVYFSSGRIFELADLYKEVFDAHGPSHPMAARLAYLYERIGQQTLAESLAKDVRDAQPEDPFAWFVYAFSLGQQTAPSDETLREIEFAFGKILELDPEFAMPGGISARQIAEQRDALRRRLEMPEIDAAQQVTGEDVHD